MRLARVELFESRATEQSRTGLGRPRVGLLGWCELLRPPRCSSPSPRPRPGRDLILVRTTRLVKPFNPDVAVAAGPSHDQSRRFASMRYRTTEIFWPDAAGAAWTVRHRDLEGTGFDLPSVGPLFERFVADYGLSSRVRVAGGTSSPPLATRRGSRARSHPARLGLDAKRALVRRVYEALPRAGAVVGYEVLIDDERRTTAAGLLISLNMLVLTHDSFDYTGADGQGWMTEAGFRDTYVQHLVGPESMVVGFK